jgi:undecaprenyl-diphosphatase
VLLQAIVLGVVQGLTEFLPVSSSAHLILVPRLFGWPDQGLAFDVALHMGTLTAVLAYFRRDLGLFARALLRPRAPESRSEITLLLYIGIATLPAVLAGLLLEEKVETVFRSPTLIAATVLGAGLLLGLADHVGSGRAKVSEITLLQAVLIGVAQSFALVPGVSRSGATITMALALGLMRPEAARFSFLLAIPVTAGAGVLKIKDIVSVNDQGALLVGFLASAAAGFFAIWFLLRYVQTRRYTPFVVYRVVLGVALWFGFH